MQCSNIYTEEYTMKFNYKSKNGDTIKFDDCVKGEEGCWSYLCEKCRQKYEEQFPLTCRISGGICEGIICGVDGCRNEADYYVDFPEN